MKRWLFAAIGICLLVLAAWLMRQGDEAVLPKTRKRVFPSHAKHEDRQRMMARRKHQIPRLLANTELPAEEPEPVDPLFVAMPGADSTSFAVVFEANAVRHSDLGNMLLRCMGPEGQRGLETLQEELKFDPIEDLDRAAFADDVMMVTGDFSKLQQDLQERSPPAERYGDNAWLLGTEGREATVVWNSEMLLISKRPEQIKEMIDRLEGRAEPSEPIIKNEMAYGEVYGVAGPELLEKLLASEDPQVQQLAKAVQDVELHVDTSEGLALSMHARGDDPERMTDLGKSMGAALAVQRMMKGSDSEFGKLLEDSRVVRGSNGNFTVELAASLDTLAEHLGDCAKPKVEPSE